MNRIKKWFSSMILLIITAVVGIAQEDNLPAFPGAEGFGKYTTGGRGGRIIYVTTLEDNNNTGSLRYAINQSGARIVMFKIAGTIQLKASLTIKQGNITIAGQTAPGDGITLRDYPFVVDADNVIIRYMRFRMGDETNQEADALGGRRKSNIIIDHCSASWSTDECISFYDNTNFTMQWCIASESLRNSVHDKGKHGYGGIWGGENASFHHNLLAHHDSRNPRYCGSRYSNQPDKEWIDHRNNVIYNWGGNSAYGFEGGSYNMVNNYYKPGPATSSSKDDRIMQPYADDGSNNQPAGTHGQFYVSGNYMTASSEVTNDNWLGVSIHSSLSGVPLNDLKANVPYSSSSITMHDAELAYEKVLDFCGASLARDSVDLRIIHETRTGTVTYPDGGNGSKNGLIDTQSAVGGWPELKPGDTPADTDEDGMPDAWEDANGLNSGSSDDAQLTTVDGVYPNIEVYLNSLVDSITTNQTSDGIQTSSIDISSNKEEVNMFIDNSAGILYVDHTKRINTVQVFSITGEMLIMKKYGHKSVQLSVNHLQKGIYIVRVQDYLNKTYSKKVLKF